MIRIGIIAPYEGFKEQIEVIYPEEVASGMFYIEPLPASLDDFPRQAKRMEKMGFDALIVRGGTYEIMQPIVSIPVVQIPIALLDVLDALSHSQQYRKRIVVVLRATNCMSLERVIPYTKYEFDLVRFEQDEAEQDLSIYEGRDVVIVGGLFACNIAAGLGLSYCHIQTTNDTIRNTISATVEMLQKTKSEIELGRLHKAILENIHDAVINIDVSGNIKTFNRQSEKLLGIKPSEAIGAPLFKVVPELTQIYESFQKGKGFADQLMKIGNLTVSASLCILKGNNIPDSALCTFQDISDLVNLENKIRMELNQKGMTAKTHFINLIAEDSTTKRIIEQAKAIAQTDAAVLIVGESGVGKEMFAQAIHNQSSRRNGPFVAVNCCSLSESLLESELFGYVEGSFTGAKKGGKMGLFELSHGGTFFLDEINSISLPMQAKLLRVLQEKEIMRIGADYVTPLDIRVIAASNETIYQKLESGEFRSDLYYRLGIFEITIPPLRQRPDDILPLFYAFCEQAKGTSAGPLSSENEEKLRAYQWTGNIRELRSVAERYALGLWKSDIRELFSVFGQVKQINLSDKEPKSLKEITAMVESQVIQTLLGQGYSKNTVADMLGISRTSLWSKISK